MMFKCLMSMVLIVLEFQKNTTTNAHVINSKRGIFSAHLGPQEANDHLMDQDHYRGFPRMKTRSPKKSGGPLVQGSPTGGGLGGVSTTGPKIGSLGNGNLGSGFMPSLGGRSNGLASGIASGIASGFGSSIGSGIGSALGFGSSGGDSNGLSSLIHGWSGHTSDSSSGVAQSKSPIGGCKSYYLVGARGTGETPTGSVAYSQLEKTVMASIPRGASEELPYSSSGDYSVTVTQGAQMGVKFITDQLSHCPNTAFILLGYSKGAMVQTQVAGSKDIPQDKIAAIVLFGNPYYRAGAAQNKCGGQSSGFAAVTGVKMADQYADRTYDCCVAGDQVCQGVGSVAGHLSYPVEHQADAARFVIEKLRMKLST